MNPEPTQASPKLTPRVVLAAAQKAMMQITASNDDYATDEPFPIEISELFLYSPDGEKVLLVFQFLGNECVLSERDIALEYNGEVVVLKEPILTRALEFLVMRIRTLRDLGF
jgi:hypothetical protein